MPLQVNEELLRDFATFGHEMIVSRDVDPTYPVLKYLEKDMDTETALWFTYLHLAYRDISSGILAFRMQPKLGYLPVKAGELPFWGGRRSNRGGKVFKNISDYVDRCRAIGSQEAFLQHGWTEESDVTNYLRFWQTAGTVWNVGRWASFKWAEILKKVHDWNLAAPDMRMEFCSGPKAGLIDLYGLPENASIPLLNLAGVDLRAHMARMHVPVADWEELETLLCNFNSLRKGRYYLGYETDEMLEATNRSALSDKDKEWVFEARRKTLPANYLGEISGWSGLDRFTKAAKAYQEGRGLIARSDIESHFKTLKPLNLSTYKL